MISPTSNDPLAQDDELEPQISKQSTDQMEKLHMEFLKDFS